MPREERRAILQMMIATAAMAGAIGHARADQPPNHHGELTVEDARATPAGRGGRSILRLRIINEGHEHAHLLGVETPVARKARIVGRIGDHETVALESIGVQADSELDLTGEHMWVELGPLTRSVKSSESIPLELVFVRGRLSVYAHVHGAEG